MPTDIQRMAYLNTDFIAPAWLQIADLVANEIIQSAWTQAKQKGLTLYVSDTSLDMSAAPFFSIADSNLSLRFPRQNDYVMHTHIHKLITVGVTVRLWAEMSIRSNSAQVTPHVAVDGNWVGDIVDWLNGWEGTVKQQIINGFAGRLGMFEAIRWVPTVLTPTADFALVAGERELPLNHAINIVLVSDGYATQSMPEFQQVVDAIVTRLTAPDPNHTSEPFTSYGRALHIWRMQVPCASSADPSHRVVT